MNSSSQAVVIGASAGALEALFTFLPNLPRDFMPIIVVVHLPPNKPSLLAQLFAQRCAMRVLEIEDKMPIETGTIYIAPPDYHALIEADHRFALSIEEEVLFSRPSIDVLFESAADAYGEAVTGIILTGANQDGAIGLKAVCAAGGRAFVQNPASAYCEAMPQAALALCPSAITAELSQLADLLQGVHA